MLASLTSNDLLNSLKLPPEKVKIYKKTCFSKLFKNLKSNFDFFGKRITVLKFF